MNTRKIEEKAHELLAQLKIDDSPVPVEKIANNLGIQVNYDKLESNLSGFLYIEKEKVLIGVNAFHKEPRQRFTIAHEIGHYLLHNYTTFFVDRGYQINFRDEVSSTGTDMEEREANEFAAALLMPENLIRKEIGDSGIDLTNESDITKLAKKFNVSQQALLIRLGKLDVF